MSNGEDLPPAWIETGETDSFDHTMNREFCRECEDPIVGTNGPYCESCQPSRYFSMG